MPLLNSNTSMSSVTYKVIFAFAIGISLNLAHSRSGAQEPSYRQPDFPADDPLIAFSRRWDIDGDRVYTCDEWRLFASTLFQTADADRDKLLEKAEIPLLVAAERIFSGISFTYFDANGDGVIDRAEFTNAPNPFFVIYDIDKDCRVTAAEQANGRR